MRNDYFPRVEDDDLIYDDYPDPYPLGLPERILQASNTEVTGRLFAPQYTLTLYCQGLTNADLAGGRDRVLDHLKGRIDPSTLASIMDALGELIFAPGMVRVMLGWSCRMGWHVLAERDPDFAPVGKLTCGELGAAAHRAILGS